MLAWDNYILRLEQEAQRLMEEAAKAELVVEEKRNLYLEASRELKVMEKLKEKREKEYRKEVLVAETSELDDMWREKR
jgi:flagellar FliJ protein